MKRGGPLKRTGSLKRSGIKRGRGPKRSARPRETAAHKRARLHFDVEVITERICFFADVTEAGEPRRPRHVCGGNGGDLDAHHLIAKSWIQRHFGDLPEDELLAIKYAVIIGCPLCRDGHDALPANLKSGDRVFFEELDDDLIEFVRRVDQGYGGQGRPSMEVRLELECPRRPIAEASAGRSGRAASADLGDAGEPLAGMPRSGHKPGTGVIADPNQRPEPGRPAVPAPADRPAPPTNSPLAGSGAGSPRASAASGESEPEPAP